MAYRARGCPFVPAQLPSRPIGMLTYIATEIAPEIRAALRTAASGVGARKDTVAIRGKERCFVSRASQAALQLVADRAFTSLGAAFTPRRGVLGKARRRRLFQFFDASADDSPKARDPHVFRGGCV